MAIYPPPPFPGGNYPSPFPRTCSSSPSPASSFPSAPDLRYAATYPPQIHHHHPFGFGAPAPAYAPAPFPAYTPAPVTAAVTHSFPSPYLSAPAPFPSTFPPPTSSSTSFPFRSSHAPVYAPAPAVSSPIPTQVDRNQPPPAAAQIHGTLSHHHFPSTPVLTPLLHRPDQASGYSSAPATFSFPCSQAPPSAPPTPATPPTLAPPPRGALSLSATADTTCLRHPDQVPSNPLPAGRSSPTPQLLDAVPTAPNTGSRIHSMVNASLNNRFFMDDDAAVQAVGDKRVPAKETIRHRLQRELLNIQARLDLEQAHERTSFNAIQCELAKLKSMVSQFVDTVGKQPISARGSKPEQSQLFSIVPAAPAHAAPKVFGETPTPISWQETHGSASNFCSGQHNLIQSSCVSNLSELDREGRPQSYGFENLNRQSILLADGTIHSYYVLPDTYPLDQATPVPVFDVYDVDTKGCTDEFVDVFINTSVQQPHKATDSSESLEELVSEQLPKCFSKAPETKQSSACWNYIKDALDNAFDKQQQDGEEVSVNVQQLRAPPLDVLVLHERRKKWDPGAPVILHSFLSLTACIQYIAPNDMSSALHATCFLLQRAANLSQGNCLCSLYCNSVFNTEYCTERMQWDPGVKIFLCSWLIILQEWSATDTQFPCTHITSVAAHAADVTPVLGFKANNTAGSGSRLIPMCSMKLPMNVQEASHVLKQMPVYGLYEEDTSCLNCMEKQLARRFHKASDNAFSEQLRDPQLKVLVIIERRKEWDPGATEFPFLFITSAGATESQVTDVFKPEFTSNSETPKLLNSWVNLKKMILWPCCKLQISTPSKLSMQSLCETISVKEENDATPMHMIMVLHLEEVTAGKDVRIR